MCCCLHVSSTCNHVSGSYELQMGQVMVGNLCLPKKSCFLAWPMYVPVPLVFNLLLLIHTFFLGASQKLWETSL